MKRIVFFLTAMIFVTATFAQIKIKNKKYQGLLWEITGNSLKKPSYLFGTMHISSKVVFNLADSFYKGIKNANVVALETNPESWQEDMSKYELVNNSYNSDSRFGSFDRLPNDYLSIHTLEYSKYEKKIEQALYTNPAVINNLLYRTYGDLSSDFEENTYLDMYIYQVGKKWGKKVAGVENYGESMKLMMEAYRDAANDKNRKEKSYDVENGFTVDKLQEAYRTGNLDLLDSLNKLQSFSNAFDEKFLYRRNEIQANSIDSILKSGSSLFVGVGAAHLPGTRGVIEILRSKGYSLRPVLMEKKVDNRQKDSVEKIHVPVIFRPYSSEDGFFKVDIPGKLSGEDDGQGMFDQRQYADMANGSYYIVTRLRTNNVMWGHSADQVYKKIDSVLYENIPGKILNKQIIYRNGYKGFDILNRTRRGDIQRYNIFITPFEIILFKMSGNDDYVKKGTEANLFFGSIRLKEYGSNGQWKKYTPPFGGFSIQLPHDAFISNDGSWLFDAEDKSDNSKYRIARTDIHNYHFAESDTFDLSLMEESFLSSEFIDKEISREQTACQGYPALNCRFKDKDGSFFTARFIIQGPHYYSLIAHHQQESQKVKTFFDSFEIKPFVYNQSRERKDTLLYYTVKSPLFPEVKKEKLEFPGQYDFINNDDDDEKNEKDALEKGIYRNTIISNDSTGQQIYVSFYKYGRYRSDSDSSWLNKKNFKTYLGGDSTWIVRKINKYSQANGMKVWEYELTKPGSSRIFLKKDFYKNGISLSLITQSDSLTQDDSFVKEFFSTFTPVDTLKGISPFANKSKEFFGDFFSSDSVSRKRAIKNINEFEPGNADFSSLKKAIESFSWQDKKYLESKKTFINKLRNIDSKESADYLKTLYYAVGDTVEIQYTILETLLQQQTKYSMAVFKDIITQEPPVLQTDETPDYTNYTRLRSSPYYKKFHLSNGDFMDELYDSLKLTRTILPGLLPLLNLDDYKWPVMKLLARMVDSNLVTTRDYNSWFNKFLLESKLELKKQLIDEKKKSIKKAENDKADKTAYSAYDRDEVRNKGNDDLSTYATLLLPFQDNSIPVQSFFQQLLQSGDEKLKYSTILLLFRNGKSVPDSLLAYFAAKDDYRYELFSDLKDIDQSKKFPDLYNNHLDLARSKLLDTKIYDKPDSLVYIDRLAATQKSNKGFVYFFKYKQKKDDDIWKLATVGLVPEDPKQFEFDETEPREKDFYGNDVDFTELSNVKLKDDEPIADQLKKSLKKLLYSTHSSAKEFYDNDDNRYNMTGVRKY